MIRRDGCALDGRRGYCVNHKFTIFIEVMALLIPIYYYKKLGLPSKDCRCHALPLPPNEPSSYPSAPSLLLSQLSLNSAP